jgi:hypothetical protein
MRVPSLGVGPTLPLFTCVLREQSTNASLRGRVTDLSKATVAGVGSMQFKSFRESKN